MKTLKRIFFILIVIFESIGLLLVMLFVSLKRKPKAKPEPREVKRTPYVEKEPVQDFQFDSSLSY